MHHFLRWKFLIFGRNLILNIFRGGQLYFNASTQSTSAFHSNFSQWKKNLDSLSVSHQQKFEKWILTKKYNSKGRMMYFPDFDWNFQIGFTNVQKWKSATMFLCSWAFNMSSLSNLRVKKLTFSSRFFFLIHFACHFSARWHKAKIYAPFPPVKIFDFWSKSNFEYFQGSSTLFQCFYPIHISISFKFQSIKKTSR